MLGLTAELLFECISDIDDFFIAEAETADVARTKAAKRKRIVKYSVAGVAGIAVSIGLAVAYKKLGVKAA